MTGTDVSHLSEVSENGRPSDDPRAFLSAAHGLIVSGWTQRADARTSNGDPTDPWNRDAVCWSLLGALTAVYARRRHAGSTDGALQALAQACVLLARSIDTDSLTAWNDAGARTQAEVLAALDQAAKPG